ncbi:amylo-alpha-1,6-glucosidase [Planosporangium thailandense]|uniref:Amylo-alpha-1,6-glucosidase n=2 Tax=Planosporangium thailandense TaxID=765197 RepID=A0ABX0XQN2_9ACTN|nr:amylo-alpha-1,6-glucosidase [Planosporangium thailandense]
MPGAGPDLSYLDDEVRELPPELGQDALAVLEGRSFMYSDSVGDVPPGSIGGLVSADTRLLDKWVLTVNDARLLTLRSSTVEHYYAAFYLTNPDMPGLGANTLGVRRERVMGGGMAERIEIRSFATGPRQLEVRLAVASDFADLFEIKECVRNRSSQIRHEHASDGSRLSLVYRNDDFTARTDVFATPPATRIEGDDLVWQVELPPGGEWKCDLYIPFAHKFDTGEIAPTRHDFHTFISRTGDPITEWRRNVARVESDCHELELIYDTTRRDLAALRIPTRAGDERAVLPAAGLPWFLTLFGRDTIITAYQTLTVGPSLARGALVELAAFQGTECNDFKDEEPGKILHEVRTGELTQLGLRPHNPYYGTADATPLWLILLSEYWRWTGDDALVRELRDNVQAALDWIDLHGDRDGDGYVEYQTRSPQGLGNQCWRDSWDGVLYSDGTMPPLPIATCEIQGYVYDAKLRVAELADGPLGNPALARALREEAEQLRIRFNEDFWIDKRGGYYALGLDGDKRPIDSMTSDMGHLLWSGIVPDDRAGIVVGQLMSDQMFSDWGIRTLATTDKAYCPIGYHRGTVWPHDNSLIAMGMLRYGHRDAANRLSMAQINAACISGNRLPEAFSGYSRAYAEFPVPYPTACNPQAWASGAPLLYLRSMLGLEPVDREVTLNPDVPDEIGRIAIKGLKAFGTRWDVEAIGRKCHVRLAR